MTNASKALGNKGEEIAARYLKKIGYRVLARSYKANNAEIDIVARDKNEIVFVEVKTRRSTKTGNPETAVTPKKRQHIQRAVEAWMKRDITKKPWRVDIIAIIIKSDTQEISHFKAI